MHTFFFLLFLVDTMTKFPIHPTAEAATWILAGGLLAKYSALLKRSPVNLSRVALQEMVDLLVRYIVVSAPVGLQIPKLPLLLHINHRASYQGNPWYLATWEDEGLSRQVKLALRLCHQCTFERQGLATMAEDLKRRGVAKRKRQ